MVPPMRCSGFRIRDTKRRRCTRDVDVDLCRSLGGNAGSHATTAFQSGRAPSCWGTQNLLGGIGSHVPVTRKVMWSLVQST